MKSLSLKEQVYEDDLMTHDPNDDPSSTPKWMSSKVKQKMIKKMILHNLNCLWKI
jgi:hypothetical protein